MSESLDLSIGELGVLDQPERGARPAPTEGDATPSRRSGVHRMDHRL
jgi:hypothetical protein